MPQSRIYNPFVGAGSGGGGGGEANTGSNVGTGTGVFRDKTGVVLNFKTFVAGSNIILTPTADEIQISALSTGEVNTGANVGTGQAIFRDKTGTTLNFKTITAGSNITLTPSANELQISSSGEANTGNNVGTGEAIFKDKTGVALNFKTLVPGANITLTPSADEILIEAAGGGSGEVNDGANVGTGAGVYKDKTGVTLNFKSFVAGSGMTITPGTNEITFSATGGGGGGNTTLISAGGNLTGTYNGDVYCQGNVNVTGAVTILGDLHVAGDLLGITGSPITVRGSVKILGRIDLQCDVNVYQDDITIDGDLIVMSTTLQSRIQANLLDNTVPCQLRVGGNMVIFGLDAKPLTDAVASVWLTVGGSIYSLQPNFQDVGIISLEAGDYISGSNSKAGGRFFVRGDVVGLTVNTSGQTSEQYGGNAGNITIGGSFIGENFWPFDPVTYPDEFPYSSSNDAFNRVSGADIICRGGNITATSGGPYTGGDAGHILIGGDVRCRDFIVKGGGMPDDDYSVTYGDQINGGSLYDVQINGSLKATRDIIVKPGDALGGGNVGLYTGSCAVLGDMEFLNCRWWPSLGFNGSSPLSDGTNFNYTNLYVRGNIKGNSLVLMNDQFTAQSYTAESDGTFYTPTKIQVDGDMNVGFVTLLAQGDSGYFGVGVNGIYLVVKGDCFIDTLQVNAIGSGANSGFVSVKGNYGGSSIDAQYSTGSLVTEGTDGLNIEVLKNMNLTGGIITSGSSSNTDGINGKNGGNITVYGDCFVSNGVVINGGEIGSVPTGNSGNGGIFTVVGKYIGGAVNCSGGFANSDDGAAGNGGSIILGSCDSAELRVRGGDQNVGSVNGFGGNGGTITINGNAILSGTTSIQIQGGQGSGAGGAEQGGAGGSLTVEGDLVANNILGAAQNAANTSLNAKNGGSITVKGNCKISTAFLNGGNASDGQGGNGGNVTVNGITTGTFDCRGGNSDTNRGGNGGNVTLFGDARIGSILSSAGNGTGTTGGLGGVIDIHGFINATTISTRGGDAATTGGKGGNQTYRGGFNINSINCEDGSGGTNTGVVSLLMRGHCTANTITSTNKSQTRIRPIDANTVSSFTGNLVGATVLYNGGNTVATGAFLNTNYYWHRGNVWYRVAGTAA